MPTIFTIDDLDKAIDDVTGPLYQLDSRLRTIFDDEGNMIVVPREHYTELERRMRTILPIVEHINAHHGKGKSKET